MAVVIVANAAFSTLVLVPRIGEYANHVCKSVVAVLLILWAFYLIARTILHDRAIGDAGLVGALWFGLTVLFEFIFGHYVFGNPWSRLLADYRFWEGRLWVLVLLADLIGPPTVLVFSIDDIL
jgi:ABC-type Fe3+ transport system permease subunit